VKSSTVHPTDVCKCTRGRKNRKWPGRIGGSKGSAPLEQGGGDCGRYVCSHRAVSIGQTVHGRSVLYNSQGPKYCVTYSLIESWTITSLAHEIQG